MGLVETHQKGITAVDSCRSTLMPVRLVTWTFAWSAVSGPVPNSVYTEEVTGSSPVSPMQLIGPDSNIGPGRLAQVTAAPAVECAEGACTFTR